MPENEKSEELPSNEKLQKLEECKETSANEFLTTNTGLKINDDIVRI